MNKTLDNNDIRFIYNSDDEDDGEGFFYGCTNDELLGALLRMLKTISDRKFIRNTDVTNIKRMVYDLTPYSLVETSQLENDREKMKKCNSIWMNCSL